MRMAYSALAALALVACATSRAREQTCDPLTAACDVDAAVDGTPVDALPLRGFGEPCTDRDMCQSNLCILVGTSGSCTQFCGECPDGWGCIGVIGIDFDGQTSFVCVPSSTQLCTTCTQDSECTLIGMDKCITYPDADQYCSQDCSSIGCPVGYGCETVDVNGTNFQQCIPSSGACDCTAANPGAVQPCNITTPFNVCLGTETCGGATGWGTCDPPSTIDEPDGTFVDSNCDGIDGDMERAIFVSGAGANTATCGLLFSDPCQTLPFAISRAQATSRPHVYVQSGTYAGPLTMANGISIFGGYNVNWQRKSHSEAGHIVTISGGNPAVRFNAITTQTILDNVIVVGSNATGVSASAIGVLVTSSSAVELRGLIVDPGAGTAGTDGPAGANGNNGGTGGTGNPGCEDSSGFCSTCSRPAGGTAGSSTCGRAGGVGGLPGNGGGSGLTGGTGSIGTAGGAGGAGGGGGNGLVGTSGSNGSNGNNGGGGFGIGTFSGFTYVVASGTSGTSGTAGNGGGGGGGGGGGVSNCDSYGSSGGGGGGGGCGGGAGTRGTGGGGSFGLVAFDSMMVIDASTIHGRTGGAGGRGGSGGVRGSGGTFGLGGPDGGGSEQDDGGFGARGGSGGLGGSGGAGGGGGGGPSIGVVCLGTSTTLVSSIASTPLGGTGGAGGASAAPGGNGNSAPTFGCPF